MMHLLEFFTNPLLRAPMIGSLLMCSGVALLGVFLFLKKESLLGETLTHTTYPGVVLSAFLASFLMKRPDGNETVLTLFGAYLSAYVGLRLVRACAPRLSSDAALCFILSLFFGVGVLMASKLQHSHPLWYRSAHTYLYGQAATLLDHHIAWYAGITGVIIAVIVLLIRPLQWIYFDRDFAKSVGVRVHLVEVILEHLLIASIVVGMCCVGVVLLSGMLIAPAIAARPWSHTLSKVLWIAALLGGGCGFVGNYLSVSLSSTHLALPTGPLILLSAAFCAVISLIFAPSSGVLARAWRTLAFRRKCALENSLKYLWKQGENSEFSTQQIRRFGRKVYRSLKRHRWIEKIASEKWRLSCDGKRLGARIVRMHRLWEVYLVESLGQHKAHVHHSAEDMEHLLSPQVEKELTALLNDPLVDPHEQPIPREP